MLKKVAMFSGLMLLNIVLKMYVFKVRIKPENRHKDPWWHISIKVEQEKVNGFVREIKCQINNSSQKYTFYVPAHIGYFDVDRTWDCEGTEAIYYLQSTFQKWLLQWGFPDLFTKIKRWEANVPYPLNEF